MKNLFLTLTTILSVFVAFSAQAGTSQTYGNTTYHTFDNGTSATSQTYGNTTYHNGNGISGTSQTYGNTTYHTWN
ncbi:hypothetical protein N9442_02835 [Gammaproteobacteria bacterium]|nr:hypothetical protein [Gammaproteobacteria bacterium]